MQSRLCAPNLCTGDFRQFLQQNLLLFPVQIGRPAQMPPVKSPLQKGRQCLLLEAGHGGCRKAQPLLIDRQQSSGQYQIGHADGGRNGTGEGAHIDDLSPVIQTLHGGDGTAGVTEFAVVIILHDEAVLVLSRPAEQRRPAADRHGTAHGKLMRGCDKGHGGTAFPQLVLPQAAVIQRNHSAGTPVVAQNLPRGIIARVFQPVDAVFRQDLHQNIEQILQTGSHHDLVGLTAHAPVFPQKLCQRLPEGHVAPGISTLQKLGILGHHFPAEPCPGGIGEHTGVHRAGGKIVPRLLPRHGSRTRRRCRRAAHRAVQVSTDIITAFGSGAEVALGSQHAVGGFHRALADVQMGANCPFGGQFFTVFQPSRLNFFNNIAIKLLIQRLFVLGLQLEGEVFHKVTSPNRKIDRVSFLSAYHNYSLQATKSGSFEPLLLILRTDKCARSEGRPAWDCRKTSAVPQTCRNRGSAVF